MKLAKMETEVTNSADAGTGSDAVRTRRRYRQLRRAELEAQTRLRISEAAMKLGGWMGNPPHAECALCHSNAKHVGTSFSAAFRAAKTTCQAIHPLAGKA